MDRAAPAPRARSTHPRQIVYRALRFTVVALLFGYVLHRARLTTVQGWSELLATLRASDIPFLAASLLFTPLVHFQSTVKWHTLTRARRMNVSLGRLYYFFVVGRFYNLVLPSNIGGDIIRIRMLGLASGRNADAAATVVVERLTGVITLTLYAAAATAIAAADFQLPWLGSAVALAAIALVAICWAIFDDRPMRRVTSLLEGRTRLIDKVVARLGRLHAAIAEFRGMPSALTMAFVHSVIFYTMAVVNVWLTVRVFDPDVPFAPMMIAVPIMMFVMNIPLSVGNFGVLEFAFTVILGAFGVSPHVALSAALLMRIKSVLAAGVGGVTHALASDGSPSADAVRAAVPHKAP